MPTNLPGIKFNFSMAMGIRQPDKARKKQLDALIEKNQAQIQTILAKYNMPLLPIPKAEHKDDD